MEGLEVTVLIGLTILAGSLLAPRVRVALPLVLVVFGLLLGFVPQLREVQLPPETVLLLFLPVMLFWESLTTSLRSIRRDFRYILPMSTVLVVASAFAVAGVGVLFGMPWEIALILGAAVAPPDATAVAALGRLLPQRSFMKLKAESLTNDGTALVLYAIAVSLAVGGNITPLSVTWTVILSYAGGIVAGGAVATLAYLLLRRATSTAVINVSLLLVPFTAFLLAEVIGASGVLAVVVAGLAMAYTMPRISTPSSRRQADSFFSFGVYLLNGALFVLIGLEVQYVAHETSAADLGWLLLATIFVWITLLAVRYLFQLFSIPFQPRAAVRPPWSLRARMMLVSTVAGMRGAVSLAIALSVPVGIGGVGRDQVVFVTAGVILLSLLVQGPLLPVVVRLARIPVDTAAVEEYELAERTISGAALSALTDLATEHGIGEEIVAKVRIEGYQLLELTNARVLAREQAAIDAEARELDSLLDEPDPYEASGYEASGFGGVAPDGGDPDPLDAGTAESGTLRMIAATTAVDVAQRSPLVRHEELTRLRLALIDRKREVLLGLRRSGAVDDLIVRRIATRLDLEQLRIEGIDEFD